MRYIFVVPFLVLIASVSAENRIKLVYGDVLEGTVIGETATTYTIRGPYGERILQKADVQEIIGETPGTGQSVTAQTVPAIAGPPILPPRSEGTAALPPAPAASPPVPLPDVWTQSGAGTGPDSTGPTPYTLFKNNALLQAGWADLEIAYRQAAYATGQKIQTDYIARIIPPDYLRAKLVTPIPPSAQMPSGGKAEYDLYRARSTLWQVSKVPGQPIQYLQMDALKQDGMGTSQLVAFQRGFAGAGTDESVLAVLANHSRVLGSEFPNGHDCWVLETVNSPELVEAQIPRYALEMQAGIRQQLSTIGSIKNWVGKNDNVQWKMESFDKAGNMLASIDVLSIKPNGGLLPAQLRMKVPKGTVWVDVTDVMAGAPQGGFNPPDGGGGGYPQQQFSQPPPVPSVGNPWANTGQPGSQLPPPQVGYPQGPPPQPSAPYPYAYNQPPPGQYQAPNYQQQMAPRGNSQTMTQQQYEQMMQQNTPRRGSGRGGGFLSRFFGGSSGRRGDQQQGGFPGGVPPGGAQTMNLQVINGQPQMPGMGQ